MRTFATVRDYSGLETAGPTGPKNAPTRAEGRTIAAWRLRGQPDRVVDGLDYRSDYSGLETAGPTGLPIGTRVRLA